MPQAIHISPIDNVVVALHPIAKGTLVEVDGLAVTALEDIPQGHKMAVKPIKNGENVIKYGFPIGHATADAAPGTWMHTHNVHTNLSGEVEYSYNPAPDLAPLPKVEPETFMGFRRKDGRAAIRNEIWIIPTVGCVNDIAKKMVADNQDLVTGSIEGLYTFTHPFGCSQTGHDHAQTRKLLAALVRHPNAAAVLVLHLGCENLQHDQFVEELGEYDHDRVKFLTCQDVEDEFAAARDILKELAAYAGQFERQPIPVSELVVGMKCGGSDGLSGIDLSFAGLLKNSLMLFLGYLPRSGLGLLWQLLYWGAVALFWPISSFVLILTSLWLPCLLSLMAIYPALEKSFDIEKKIKAIREAQLHGDDDQ